MKEYVFVYGTLRPPKPDTPDDDSRYYPQIADYIQAVALAQLPDAALYDLGAYPALRPGEGMVHGELLTVEPVALAIMDRIEGHPAFYRRDRAVVHTQDGPAEAWVYWAPDGLSEGHPRITGGDWFRRPAASPPPDSEAAEDPQAEAPPIDPVLHKLVARFAQAEASWLSSVRPGGQAHSAPVWHVWRRGRIYVVTTSTAIKVENILENPGVVMTHPDPMDPVIIEGWATLAQSMRPQLRPLFKAKHDWDIDSSPEYDTVLEIIPTKLLAWGKHGEGRWSGSEAMRVRLL